MILRIRIHLIAGILVGTLVTVVFGSSCSVCKVVHIPIEENESARDVLVFATGWLEENTWTAPGRPVGVTVAPDGALMISDDKAGVIYRVSYRVVGP